MNFNECLPNVTYNWVLGLPEQPAPRNIYFVRTGSTVLMYVTDGQGNAYLVGGGGEGITLSSPNGTIDIINGQQIDVSQDILDSIISLHNLFPDLQGGTWHFDEASHDYLQNVVDNDLINQDSTYNGASPSTISVGGIPTGYTLTGKTYEEIIQQMLVVYQSPAFSTFLMQSQSTLIEVGTALSGSKTFTWSTTNSGNVATNSIAIRDVTDNTLLATGLANDGTEAVSIGTITNTTPITQSWRAEGINTNSLQFNSSSFTVASIYPVFWYKSNSPITPSSMQAAIAAGTATKIVTSSTGTISIPFAAAGEYIAVAHPATSTTKTVWFVSLLNNGLIPGGVFNGQVTLPVSSPTGLWSAINYKIYVSPGLITEANPIELRNS